MDIQRFHTTPRMSKATAANGTVWLAGIVVDKPAASIAEETRHILETIDGLLAEAGSDRAHIVSALFWVSDMRYYDEMNAVWDAWLPSGCAPSRACTQAILARPHCRVEIMVTAVVSGKVSA